MRYHVLSFQCNNTDTIILLYNTIYIVIYCVVIYNVYLHYCALDIKTLLYKYLIIMYYYYHSYEYCI